MVTPPPQGLFDPRAEHDACGVGFVVNIKGHRSHDIVRQAMTVLINLEHRGACGCEANTGDGAGILVQMPDRFLRKVAPFALPPAGAYGAGLVFLPREARDRDAARALITRIVAEEGQRLLGWREVPNDNSLIGDSAKAAQPVFEQIFVGAAGAVRQSGPPSQHWPVGSPSDPTLAGAAFERKLYVIRKRIEHAADTLPIGALSKRLFYIVSLSANTLIYKGMLTARQLEPMYPDLTDTDLESALALVHQRFSTNTFPSWPLAHPYRYIAHNGEINTLLGNINWMRAREGLLQSERFGDDLRKLLPVIREGGSDTATFDNVLEFLVMNGRSLPHAILMMIPEPWSGNESMDPDRRAFYEYHASLMEPWDGPASIAFTDGTVIGAVLDRNGLRPSRYYVTKNDLVIMASEVGVLDIPPEDILVKERLHPGRIFLVDTSKGRIVDDEEIKRELAAQHPYRKWLDAHLIDIDDLPPARAEQPEHESVLQRQLAFGYTQEDLRILLGPMAMQGEEPIGSMGTDTSLAVLSQRPRLLFDYFKQLFAQVTNPPLDAIREELVTDMGSTIGPERNLLRPEPESCRQIQIKYPIIHNEQVAKLRHLTPDIPFRSTTLSLLFDPAADGDGLERAMTELCRRASEAVAAGYDILILSDRGLGPAQAPVPSLLATAGVHHHLVREGTRTRCALVVECGDAREVHHVSLLLGYGAGVVNPYVAFETIDDMIRQGMLPGIDRDTAIAHYIKALNKGVLKVMSKMGISTLQSYCGAQIFEAIGLSQAFIDRYFTHTMSRVSGVGIEVIAREVGLRHERAFGARPAGPVELDGGGEYQWRRDGEYHLFNPETVFKLQHATRSGQYSIFKEYTRLVDRQNRNRATLRGLFRMKPVGPPVPIDEVEPVEAIVKRFATGAMSYGSISQEAHETLAIAMNRIGGKSNTGEGGEDPERYVPDPNGDSRRSAIKQVASARFGVTSEYLVNADDLQIKMAQGAKPGEGGQLPGAKVYPWIAKTRYATPYVGLISPPPHHDIYSIEDLAQLIYDLKNSNPRARIHVKLVAEGGVGTVAAGVAKAHSDVVLISGHDGGTGASPLTSLKHAGLPWELGLAETQQVLVLNKLRDRIVVQIDGQLKTGRDVVIGALLGAEEFGFATAPLVVMGCVMMRVCHLNTCPVGIATQDPELRKKFAGRPEFVENFFRFIALDVRELMAELGFRTMDEMIGRADCLDVESAVGHWKADGLDLAPLLHMPDLPPGVARRKVVEQDHGIDRALDNELIARCRPALEQGARVEFSSFIRNSDRTVGTMLGSEVTRRYGGAGLPEDTIRMTFHGSAGQSFGAFLPRGITMTLVGDANDGFGKGLSGGRLIAYPPLRSTFRTEENILLGNVAFYGATAGDAYVSGAAGERFCVRNSGAHVVVEAIGDHGCEYMTGGRVLILGRTGRNFAAGMSGGIAYVLDADGQFERRCNLQMIDLEPLAEPDDMALVHVMLMKHVTFTGSRYAARLLEDWPELQRRIVKVMPREYKKALANEARRKAAEEAAAVA
ncbi:MAG: glutamate synthase subunit alpha [Acidobacteria bacterium RIFCSPLOWO2_12_FULL_67_14]|nr:MAG: glutamate synthase subunit alpha [Acidobacteria bacterium RIFCSPLOWO2_12_FULL_67_14]